MLRQDLMYQGRLNSLCNWDGLNSYPSTSQCTSPQEASITFNHQALQSLSVWESASVLHVSELAAWADPKQSRSFGSVSCFLWITLRSGPWTRITLRRRLRLGQGMWCQSIFLSAPMTSNWDKVRMSSFWEVIPFCTNGHQTSLSLGRLSLLSTFFCLAISLPVSSRWLSLMNPRLAHCGISYLPRTVGLEGRCAWKQHSGSWVQWVSGRGCEVASQTPSGGRQPLSFPRCDQSLCWDAKHTWTLFCWLRFLLLVVGVLHVAWILILCICVLPTFKSTASLSFLWKDFCTKVHLSTV